MKYIILFSALFFSISAVAQTCNTDILIQTPGSWKARPQGSASVLSAADLAREKKIVATLHSMIQSKYTPMGLRADFLGSYGRAEPNMPGNYFGYTISSYIFYCDGITIVKEQIRDYYTEFFINANLFENEIYDTTDESTGRSDRYYAMSNMPVYKDGVWFFKEITQGLGAMVEGKKSSWLVTYNNQLPFAYVTKKNF